jgi:ATP-binding cassette subfamily B protein
VLSKQEIDSLSLAHIDYGYAAHEKVIHDLSFRFEHGKTYAIIGPSGSGKSTLADILLGLVPPQSGTVAVNDGRLVLGDVLGRIMLVEQQPKIFSTTVRDNLLFGHQADDATLWAALQMVDMQEHIGSMRAGLDTPLSYLGENLSGGQRQRIGIARALVRNPDVLILDEATSALDARTRALVVHNIRQHLQNGIIVFITHDAEIADLADERLVLHRNRDASASPA